MKIQKRLDYTPPAYTISSVALDITLEPKNTQVVSTLQVEKLGDHNQPLFLHGEDLQLNDVKVNGEPALALVTHTEGGILIPDLDAKCTIEIVNCIAPADNTSLEGLYQAGDTFCTQCEAEGFRRITYYMDRPDVLAEFTVTLRAPANKYPYLLANGNKLSESVDSQGLRVTVWHDPFPKPAYLFALVAGDFDLLTDSFVTGSGREVALHIYVDKGCADRAKFALAALQRSMQWDEETYGFEYDLDIYMIVAVDFFNMGAMENKGLNIFNSKYILADSSTATDEDFFNVEAVVAHEYFHNWTGNRITCRDWFQLSLKEGLTVFRDQQFSADMASPLRTRIAQAKVMREHQFAEDASAMSHPIRPDEVIEMNNFYTVTVYDKGAEVIRMLHSIVGEQAFYNGMAEYTRRHDGQAVTCDDFVDAMQYATDVDLSQFRLWYSQSGTPRVEVEQSAAASDNVLKVKLSQSTPATADQQEKQSLLIPLRFHCYDDNASPLSVTCKDAGAEICHDNLLLLKDETTELEIHRKTPSISATITLHGNFSAPIILKQARTEQQLSHIAQHDPDPFTRWDTMQTLFAQQIDKIVQAHDADISLAVDVTSAIIKQYTQQPELLAELITVPSTETLFQRQDVIEPLTIYKARNRFCQLLAEQLEDPLRALLPEISSYEYKYEQQQVATRSLRKSVLYLLALLPNTTEQITQLYNSADNMTDQLCALKSAQLHSNTVFTVLMAKFEQQWQHDGLVMDKWFALHATQESDDILSTLSLLQQHPRFSANNPNRVRSVMGSFAFYNTTGFHAEDGSGYRYIADYLIELDKLNPQVASRIVTPLTQWHKFAPLHQSLMKSQLSRLVTTSGLSKDVFEKVSKSLTYEQK